MSNGLNTLAPICFSQINKRLSSKDFSFLVINLYSFLRFVPNFNLLAGSYASQQSVDPPFLLGQRYSLKTPQQRMQRNDQSKKDMSNLMKIKRDPPPLYCFVKRFCDLWIWSLKRESSYLALREMSILIFSTADRRFF